MLRKIIKLLESAKILLKNKKLEEAISMAYYSMYYSLLALLFRVGIKSENHTVSIILLKELFGLDNSEILEAKEERIDKQYYVDFKIAEEDVKQMIRAAEHFNAEVFDYMEKLNAENIRKIRDKFKKIIS
ncbi:DNA-binding protein [Candidatus Pacearchaeota archaeon ex4484_31]|nr:MAG: DNA-binding protein [Candidatus Pacearchaeota archaeon ex4484_31]